MGFISSAWERQHGRQLMLSATAFGATLILLLVSGYQLLFLQDNSDWQDYTGAAIGMAVISSILLLIITPEFLSTGSFEIEQANRLYKDTASLVPMYDPKSVRTRS